MMDPANQTAKTYINNIFKEEMPPMPQKEKPILEAEITKEPVEQYTREETINKALDGLSKKGVILVPVSAFAQTNFRWGSYLRLRHEYWKNWKDMDNDQLDNRNFFRIKTSLWGQVDYDKDLSLFAKLSNEFRAHTYFGGTSGSFPDKASQKKGYHFDINEVVFDNLYLDVKNFLSFPVDLRLGRQDFLGTYGEGFLIMDGTPQDGSRTFYFNAAKASWRVDDNNTLDFIYINDPRDEEYLPVINRVKLVQQSNPQLDKAPQNLNTTDEEGYVLYLKNKAIKDLALEGYYIFKREAKGGAGLQAEKGKVNTLGSFVKYNFAPWALRGQIASQFGDYGNNDRKGLGGYIYLDRDLGKLVWAPKASIGYVYLSGDDKKTSDNEAWDPLFSRWPWLSELYVMSMASDAGVLGYWTNLAIWRAELVLKPTAKTKLSLWYNFLRANEQATASAILSGAGKNRGHLPQAKIEYSFNKNVSAYFLGEYLFPGNFYKDHDGALFLRTELQLKF